LRETDRYHFFKTDTDNLKKFTNIWPAVVIPLVTDTEIPKSAYRYFNKVFWLKLFADCLQSRFIAA